MPRIKLWMKRTKDDPKLTETARAVLERMTRKDGIKIKVEMSTDDWNGYAILSDNGEAVVGSVIVGYDRIRGIITIKNPTVNNVALQNVTVSVPDGVPIPNGISIEVKE